METKLRNADLPGTIEEAAKLLREGQLVALPTETVYGLGANGLSENAVAKIFEAKGRPQDNPLILHIADASQMEDICHSIPKEAYLLAEKFWPGPLTMVLPAKDIVPKRTTGGFHRGCPLSGSRRHPGYHPAGGRSHRRPLGKHLRQALHHHRLACLG